MEIRFVKKSEWEQLKAFNEVEYRPDHILANKKFIDWQYGPPRRVKAGGPLSPNQDEYTVVGVFSENGDLVGTFGMFLSGWNSLGKEVIGNSLCNLIVKKDMRSLGYGYLLLEKAMKYGDIVIDHGINEPALPLFKKSGFRFFDLKRYFYIINPQKTKEIIGDETADVRVPENSPVGLNGVVFEVVDLFDDSINGFWERVKERYPITITRTADYLNWRYAQHAFFDYKCFIARKDSNVGALAIVRIEEPENQFKVAHLVDFVSTKELEEYTLAKVVDYCIKKKVDWLDYFFSSNFHQKTIEKLGFINGDTKPYDLIPMLLNPIDRVKRVKINVAVKGADPKDVYTTKGGGDQDRPN